jgi:enoyl-CoA hydratase
MADVVFEQRGHLGVVTLNRPRAINAISHGMVRLIKEQLDSWSDNDDIHVVLLLGSGERGLCAGGDIVSLYRTIIEKDAEAAHGFWRDEYLLDHAISQYPKPVVAIMDGIVLGGGIGISAHGSHRVVTERSRLGLPETNIGFVPDVGASWLLSRAPGELGTYMALTAETIGPGDAIAIGLADHFVPSEKLTLLIADLMEGDVEGAISRHAGPAPASPLVADRPWIDSAFSAASVPEILDRLRSDGLGARGCDVAEVIESKSPIAVAVALESLRRAVRLNDLGAALEQEFQVSVNTLFSHDFKEGVRAQVIEKDRSPAWRPAKAAEVTRSDIEAYFDEGDAQGLGGHVSSGRPR